MGESFSRGLLNSQTAAQFAAADNTAQGVRWGTGLLRASCYPNANASRAVLDSPPKIPYSQLRHMPQPLKPHALRPGDAVRVLSLASPVAEERVTSGCEELSRLGYVPKLDREKVLASMAFLLAPQRRVERLQSALAEPETQRDLLYARRIRLELLARRPSPRERAEVFCSASAISRRCKFFLAEIWLGHPLRPDGCRRTRSRRRRSKWLRSRKASRERSPKRQRGWSFDLKGEPICAGKAEGTLLGGCLTLVETTLGTPWELNTGGAILILEDRGMKPYQVDRSLMHLKQAGKFRGRRGNCSRRFSRMRSAAGNRVHQGYRRAYSRAARDSGVLGAPIGHTSRPMLTIPLGVRARLSARPRLARNPGASLHRLIFSTPTSRRRF